MGFLMGVEPMHMVSGGMARGSKGMIEMRGFRGMGKSLPIL